MALRGAAGTAPRTPRRKIVVSAIEHHAVLNTAKALAEEGWPVEVGAGARRRGASTSTTSRPRWTTTTALVAVMLANNETGRHPARGGRGGPRARARGALVHCDAVQAAGKIPIDVRGARRRPAGALRPQDLRTQGRGRALREAGHAPRRRSCAAARRSATAAPAPRTSRASWAWAGPRRFARRRARPRSACASPRCATGWRSACWPSPAPGATATARACRTPPTCSFAGVEAESLLHGPRPRGHRGVHRRRLRGRGGSSPRTCCVDGPFPRRGAGLAPFLPGPPHHRCRGRPRRGRRGRVHLAAEARFRPELARLFTKTT